MRRQAITEQLTPTQMIFQIRNTKELNDLYNSLPLEERRRVLVECDGDPDFLLMSLRDAVENGRRVG